MKYFYLCIALIASVFTTTARAETINCTEITAIPMVITVQGVYCLKSNKATSLTVGNMIDIQTNNVTIDFNGFKLGGLSAGAGTRADGVFAQNRKNITIRNGAIRGFSEGVVFSQVSGISSGHLIEDMLLDGNRGTGIRIEGRNIVVRRNRVVNTGPHNFSNASGIYVSGARNVVIAGNLISGTFEEDFADGIFVQHSTLIEVRGNTILDTRGIAFQHGIYLFNSTDITLIGNRVINAAGAGAGTDGIIDGSFISTGVNCIDNTVAGFATALTGCDFLAGNITP